MKHRHVIGEDIETHLDLLVSVNIVEVEQRVLLNSLADDPI